MSSTAPLNNVLSPVSCVPGFKIVQCLLFPCFYQAGLSFSQLCSFRSKNFHELGTLPLLNKPRRAQIQVLGFACLGPPRSHHARARPV